MASSTPVILVGIAVLGGSFACSALLDFGELQSGSSTSGSGASAANGTGSGSGAGATTGSGTGGSVPITCGNGKLDEGEHCEGIDLGGADCAAAVGKPAIGVLSCTATCSFDLSGCQYCGDGVVDPGEDCDGPSFGMKTCATEYMPAAKGPLLCTADCKVDTKECAICGDAKIGGFEACDGAALGGATCATVVGPAATGTLQCSPHCQFDTTLCTPSIPCGSMGGLQKGAPWPMLAYCPTHPGRSPVVGATTNAVMWQRPEANYCSDQSPAVALDGTIYVQAGYQGNPQGDPDSLTAFDSLGNKKWGAQCGYVGSTPAIATDGTVYLGSDDGKMRAFAPDGSKKWEFITTGKLAGSAPVIGGDGTVYFGSDDQKLYALSPLGKKVWAFDAGWNVYGSPAITADGTTIIVPAGYPNDGASNWVYAVTVTNPPTKKWEYHVGSVVSSHAAIGADGTIYVGSATGTLHAIDPKTGKANWVYPTPDGWISSAVLANDGTIYFTSKNRLYAVHPDGTDAWQYDVAFGATTHHAAVGGDGTIYLTDGHKLVALDPSGGVVFFTDTPGPVGAVAIGQGALYFGTFDGHATFAVGP